MQAKKDDHACRHACTRQPVAAIPAAKKKPCDVCPPCQAPCNPAAPPTPAEREAASLAVRLQQTEESFKSKITECAVLRAEVVKRKEETERERSLRNEATARLKELEEKFALLGARALHMLGVKEQAVEQEVAVSTLKQCYREAREEIDELRMLLAEQNLQVQDYRAKYQRAQQTVEEQKRQLALQDMDNQRIADQINLEIHRIKLKFQEKLSELSPLPEVLKHTQRRLMEAQQSQALAEHKADNLTKELTTAREKLHMLLHTITKPPPEKGPEKNYDEKMVAQAQARATQLAEMNASLKQEIERLKLHVIRMEETVLQTDKRLQEKMHECAALGGELERARDHATREILLANQRADTARACLETTVTELERKLVAANKALATAELDREETQKRMQCQLGRLEESLEQAELRVLALAAQAAALRRRAAGNGDEDDDQVHCECKSFFEDA
ncbi:tropomyosin alpha-3 chain-like [Cydia fagiglandana]|uniref:tropomyosin alpha-3 chain-like n=1 Tax=Cydia fagiglandana TaxID=1458189 RepID=UPI002FEDF8EF